MELRAASVANIKEVLEVNNNKGALEDLRLDLAELKQALVNLKEVLADHNKVASVELKEVLQVNNNKGALADHKEASVANLREALEDHNKADHNKADSTTNSSQADRNLKDQAHT